MLAGLGGVRTPGADNDPAFPRHAACGSALSARWYCVTCDRPVERAGGGDDPPAEPPPAAGARADRADGLVWM